MQALKRIAFLPALVVSLAFAACGGPPKEQADPFARPHESVGYINGTAKVLSLDKALGHAVLQIDDQQVQAYWILQTDLAQGGLVSTDNPVTPGYGQYTPPQARTQNFDAVPGDTIAFVGLKTGDDILLRGIKVIARAR